MNEIQWKVVSFRDGKPLAMDVNDGSRPPEILDESFSKLRLAARLEMGLESKRYRRVVTITYGEWEEVVD